MPQAGRMIGFCGCLLAVLAGPMPVWAGLPMLASETGIPTLAPLLERVTPAVVNISVVTREAGPRRGDPSDFLHRFFGLPEPEAEGNADPRLAAGSGVIIDAAKGYVLTNHHVIEDAEDIIVTLKDRREVHGKLVGSDAGTDIALLHIEADGLTALTIGESDALRVGDIVVAIGNPFGIGQTVTSGIVSALGRSGLSPEGYEDFIQTDASINPGNSGGALIDLKGELVGINAAILGPSGGNVGIGFAVPSRMARAVMEQLIQYGEVRRGLLGIEIQELTPDLAESMRLRTKRGAIITKVGRDTAAEQAGLRPGDVVVAVDGEILRGVVDLRNRVGLAPVGTVLRLSILREGKPVDVSARVGQDPRAQPTVLDNVPALGGASLRDLPRDRSGPGGITGVLVVAVEPGSPAWGLGLREGDVIVALNRYPVTSSEELLALASRTTRGALALHMVRAGRMTVLAIR